MVDADTSKTLMVGVLRRQRVDHLRHVLVLDAHRHQIIDREEPPHVAGGVAPVLQEVVLSGQQLDEREVLGARRQRQSPLVVDDEHITVDGHRTLFDRLLARCPEDGQDDASPGELPVDVEPGVGVGTRAVAQQGPPCRVEVGSGRGDVVGDVVEDHRHAALRNGVQQPLERRRASELDAHRSVIDHVVSVGRVGYRLADRRQVQVADAEPTDVVEQVDRGIETELRRQLESVGGNRFDDLA